MTTTRERLMALAHYSSADRVGLAIAAYRMAIEDAARAINSESGPIIRIAAELATGAWLLSEFGEDHGVRVPKDTLRKIAAQNDRAKVAAITLRRARDQCAAAVRALADEVSE